jgi:hypothetical protein
MRIYSALRAAFFLTLACIFTACSAKQEIAAEAAKVSDRAVAVTNHVTDAQADLRDASTATGSVADQLTTALDNSDPNALEVAAKDALSTGLPATQSAIANANTRLEAAKTAARDIKGSADRVLGAVEKVEDRPGFFARLGGLLTLFFWLGVATLVTVIAWRFGADKLVKSVFTAVSNGISWLSAKLYSKWSGVAKLGYESAEGKTGLNEFLAALREKVPGFNKAFVAAKTKAEDASKR